MEVAKTIRPQELITSGDSEPILKLFAETLQLANAAKAEKCEVPVAPPGPYWLLANQGPPVAELQAFRDGVVPQDWPPWFQRNRGGLQKDALYEAFLHCLECGPERGIESGRDLCRLMAAVAQTLYSTNLALVRRNRQLAARWADSVGIENEWSDEKLFVSHRPDERGGYLSAGKVSLWMASHIGPNYADKLENQDAVCARPCGGGLVFALADGVTTSLGSRFAAALASFWFCREARAFCQVSAPEPEMLIKAARLTQQSMDAMLERLLVDPVSADMGEILRTSNFQRNTADAMLGNTKTAEMPFLEPALATTLIGGFILPAACTGEFSAAVICVGDGAVERIGQDGQVEQIFATDPAVTEIGMAMGPGPLAREALQGNGIEPRPITLKAGDYLLVSSDGLARGHQESIWKKANELVGDIRPQFRRCHSCAAGDLLRDLAAAAEKSDDSGHLFDDNVSLILVAVG